MTPLLERLSLLRRLLADELKSQNCDNRYVEDLRISIERAETTLDKMMLWRAGRAA